jgi:uncharacterized protein
MGTYLLLAWDTPGSDAKRNEHRSQHFAHIERIIDTILIAGPMKDADGTFTGSMLVVKADDKAAATDILKSDPYFAGGVWERFEVHDYVAAAGEWIGGKIW